jgi:hypothetical protein
MVLRFDNGDYHQDIPIIALVVHAGEPASRATALHWCGWVCQCTGAGAPHQAVIAPETEHGR